MNLATPSTQKPADKHTAIPKREHHTPASTSAISIIDTIKLQRSYSFPKQKQILYREISNNNVTFFLSHTPSTMLHRENQKIIHFQFDIKIGNSMIRLNRINFEDRDKQLKKALQTLKFCPDIQIEYESNQHYYFPIKLSYSFGKLLKNGTSHLRLDANQFTCFDFINYLHNGQEDLRSQRFTLTPKCPLIRNQDNTGKSIVLSHDEQVHAALVISQTELTVSCLGRKGLFFCRLGDLIELYQQHEGKPLEVYELTISVKTES